MKPEDVLARVRAQLRPLRATYYSSPGDAFAHYALRVLFEVDDADALEYADIGARNDIGINAFWHDEDERRLVLVQSTYSERGDAKLGKEAITDLAAALRWLERVGRGEGLQRVNDHVRAAAQQLRRLRSVDPDYPMALYCVGFGNFTRAATDEAERYRESAASGVSLTLVDFAGFQDALEEQDSRLGDAVADLISLDLESYFEFHPSAGQPRAVVATINAARLAEIERQYQYRIFQQNVRYYLKAGQKVNRSIADTVALEAGRTNFWYYNNGIAIVCDQYEISVGDPTRIRLRNMQIVNGCQTTTTLGANLAHLTDVDSPAHVLVRIIEAADPELQRNITLYNNRQNAVRDRDLLSNDSSQDRLQGEFNRLLPPWYYERKRGEWDAVIRPSAKHRQRYGRPARRIDNETAAQAAYAFYFDPGEARARKRLLFMPASDNGFYDAIFNDDTTAEWLLFPFRLDQLIASRKREYLSKLRNIDETRANVKEKRLLDRAWVKFGDQMILGAMGVMVRERLTLDLATLQTLLDDFDLVSVRLYGLAADWLHMFFRRKQREYKQRDEPFVVANFVKGNWDEVREAILDEWELRESQDEDVFADIASLRT